MQTEPRQGSLDELRDELTNLRSVVKTKLHLASLDARNEFAEIEAKAKQLQLEMKKQSKDTRKALLADATTVVRRLRKFVEEKLPASG